MLLFKVISKTTNRCTKCGLLNEPTLGSRILFFIVLNEKKVFEEFLRQTAMGHRNAYFPIPTNFFSDLRSRVRRDYLHEESFLILPTALKTFNP